MKTDWVPLTRKKTGQKEHFRKSRVETFVKRSDGGTNLRVREPGRETRIVAVRESCKKVLTLLK